MRNNSISVSDENLLEFVFLYSNHSGGYVRVSAAIYKTYYKPWIQDQIRYTEQQEGHNFIHESRKSNILKIVFFTLTMAETLISHQVIFNINRSAWHIWSWNSMLQHPKWLLISFLPNSLTYPKERCWVLIGPDRVFMILRWNSLVLYNVAVPRIESG